MRRERGAAIRAAILAVVAERPGASLAEIGEAVDRARSSVKHHLDLLVDDGAIARGVCGACGSKVWVIVGD